MTVISDPAEYDAWYHTPRGMWISDIEFSLLMKLMSPLSKGSLLDVGCGTGHFSRLFAQTGFGVTGIDPDSKALSFAESLDSQVRYVKGDVTELPFPDKAFDVCCAVTSLCFVSEPVRALEEMWRVSRRGVILGLLNRHSLLYFKKHEHGAYRGARWDVIAEVREWCRELTPLPEITVYSAVWFPGGGWLACTLEPWMPNKPYCGGFLGIGLTKKMIGVSKG